MTEKNKDTATNQSKDGKNTKTKIINLPHDALAKHLLENKSNAIDFLNEYLPPNFKDKIDLSTLEMDKETFIEKHLVRRASDVLYKVKTKDNKDILIYQILLEQQSKPDYWISFRLLKYTLLILERYKDEKKNKKLPIICPMVWYTGSTKYNAPRSFFELFDDSKLAKEVMGDQYKLIDLGLISDDDLKFSTHLSSMLYMMKHIKRRDALTLLQEAIQFGGQGFIEFDATQDYIHIKAMICYIGGKIKKQDQPRLGEILKQELPEVSMEIEKGSIAEHYINEGMALGVEKGMEKGKADGIAIGVEKGKANGIAIGVEKGKADGIAIGKAEGKADGAQVKSIEVTTNMLLSKFDPQVISSVTGLSIDEILKIKAEL